MRPAVSSHGTNRVSSMAHGTINVPIGIPTAVRVSLGVLLCSKQIEATYCCCSGRSFCAIFDLSSERAAACVLAGAETHSDYIGASFPTWVVLVEAPSHIPAGIPTAHACNGGVSPFQQFFVFNQ